MICFSINKAQARNGVGSKYSIEVNESSYLIINGSTNMGEFFCHFNMEALFDRMEIELCRNENGFIDFNEFELILPVSEFDCGNFQMNKDFMHLLNEPEFPQITWRIIGLDTSSIINNGRGPFHVMHLKSFILIAGRQREYGLDVLVSERADQIIFKGELPLNIREFDLEPPQKFFGLVEVLPGILIRFSIEVAFLKH